MKGRPESERQALIAELRQLQSSGLHAHRQLLLVGELRADWELGWPPFLPYPEQAAPRRLLLLKVLGAVDDGYTSISRLAARIGLGAGLVRELVTELVSLEQLCRCEDRVWLRRDGEPRHFGDLP